METGGPSAIVIIFWVLAANLVLILSGYGLYKLLRQRSQDTIREIAEQIQGFASQMNQLASFLQSYAGIDQEPFFTPLDELQSEAVELESRLQHFLTTCRAFEEEIHTPGSSNQLQEIINAPIIWFRRWRRSQELRHESTAIAGQMDAAEKRMQRIYELPWELASECRQAQQEHAELQKAAQALQNAGVRGTTLQKMFTQLPLMQRALENIPQQFMKAGQEELLAAANLDTTIRVFEALNSLRPALNRYLPLAKEWNTSYHKASADYKELKHAGARLRQALQDPPSGLVVSPLQARLDHVAQMAAEAGQTMAQLEAEQIKPLSREISQLLRVVQDTEKQYAQAGQQVTELNQTLNGLKTGLDQLHAQYRALENSPSYPLVWDASNFMLSDLRQRLALLGAPGQPRTPDQIKQHLKECNGFQQEYSQLAERTPKVASQHSALVTLLDSPRISEGEIWLRKTRDMLAETEAYDPKNWAKNDSLPTLMAEIEELARMQVMLVPDEKTAPVKETEIEQRLKKTQELAEQHKNLYPRVENVRARLEKLQALEEECKEKLTEAWNALDQVDLLTESNPLLEEIAAGEIKSLMEEIRQLGNELNARGQGEVEKKAQKINVQVERVNQAFNQWLARLNGAVSERGKQIKDRLIEIDAITLLEDPPVEQARSMLEKEEFLSSAYGESSQTTSPAVSGARAVVGRVAARIPRFEQKAVLSNLEVMAEIKRKNDLWQTLNALQKGLEERSAPLLAAYQDAVQARSEARERLGDSVKAASEKRSWPPSNQAAPQESQIFQPIDEKWKALKKQRVTAEWAILELGRQSQEYRLASERLQQIFDRIRQDQEKVQDLEWQIESLKQRWLTQSEPSNPVMRESIRQLLSQTDSKLSYIKQQYLRGVLSYDQSVQNMQLLYEDLHSARVPVDEKNEVGLNESHRRAEQT
jgi:DNA repair exonuclease SbcCD ATPase subunit